MARLLIYLLNLIFAAVFAWIVSRIVQRLFGSPRVFTGGPRNVAPSDRKPIVRGETARDPVCGMFVSTEVSHRLKHGNETLHFCSRECLDRYQAEARHS